MDGNAALVLKANPNPVNRQFPPPFHPASLIPTLEPPEPSRGTMAKNYQRLWKEVTSAIDETKAVRNLAEILADKEGRTFVLRLGRRDAELCIEILDHVGRDLHLSPSP